MGQILCCCSKEHELANTDEFSSTEKQLSLHLKLLLLGDSNVGKTSLFKRLTKNTFEAKHKPTIGPDFVTRQFDMSSNIEGDANGMDLGYSNLKVSIQVWDTAGKQRYRDLGTIFYRGSNIVIFMYDLNRKRSIENLPSWMRKFESANSKVVNVSESSETNKHGMKFEAETRIGYIIGNKCDCIDTSNGMVTEGENETISKLLKENDWIKGHYTISCKTMESNEIMKTIEKMIESYIREISACQDTKQATQNTSDNSNTSKGEKTPLLLEKYQR